MGVPSSYVFAKDNKRHEEKCTLKNKVFCGEWEDSQGFHTRILGYKITSYDSRPYQSDCQIIDEFIDKKYPYSILKCLYYDDWYKKYTTMFYIFFLSKKTEENTSKNIEEISYRYDSNIAELILDCDSSVQDRACENYRYTDFMIYNLSRDRIQK